MKEYKVMASSMDATYSAGRFCADTPEQAIEMARDGYRCSPLGRRMNDVGAYRFYTVNAFPYEDAETD